MGSLEVSQDVKMFEFSSVKYLRILTDMHIKHIRKGLYTKQLIKKYEDYFPNSSRYLIDI